MSQHRSQGQFVFASISYHFGIWHSSEAYLLPVLRSCFTNNPLLQFISLTRLVYACNSDCARVYSLGMPDLDILMHRLIRCHTLHACRLIRYRGSISRSIMSSPIIIIIILIGQLVSLCQTTIKKSCEHSWHNVLVRRLFMCSAECVVARTTSQRQGVCPSAPR